MLLRYFLVLFTMLSFLPRFRPIAHRYILARF